MLCRLYRRAVRFNTGGAYYLEVERFFVFLLEYDLVGIREIRGAFRFGRGTRSLGSGFGCAGIRIYRVGTRCKECKDHHKHDEHRGKSFPYFHKSNLRIFAAGGIIFHTARRPAASITYIIPLLTNNASARRHNLLLFNKSGGTKEFVKRFFPTYFTFIYRCVIMEPPIYTREMILCFIRLLRIWKRRSGARVL